MNTDLKSCIYVRCLEHENSYQNLMWNLNFFSFKTKTDEGMQITMQYASDY